MAKVISVTNQKGGVGKTSTTEALAACLKQKKYRVLCVDFDPQGDLSFSIGAETEDLPTIYDVLRGSVRTSYAIQKTPSFDIIASNILLSGIELEFTQRDREFLLRTALEAVQDRYDFIFIDTPPGLGVLTVNAFAASDSIIIPALADIFSLKGIVELYDTISRIKKRCNPKLQLEGILLTRYNSRSVLARTVNETAEMVAKQLGTIVFQKKIRTNGAISEAQAKQQHLFEYAPQSIIIKDYMKVADEVLERGQSLGQ